MEWIFRKQEFEFFILSLLFQDGELVAAVCDDITGGLNRKSPVMENEGAYASNLKNGEIKLNDLKWFKGIRDPLLDRVISLLKNTQVIVPSC